MYEREKAGFGIITHTFPTLQIHRTHHHLTKSKSKAKKIIHRWRYRANHHKLNSLSQGDNQTYNRTQAGADIESQISASETVPQRDVIPLVIISYLLWMVGRWRERRT